MTENKSKISNSIIISYISILFTLISGFLYTPWLIRELGTSDYAIYSIATSLIVYFTVDFGMGATITRFVAKYRAQGNQHKINGILGISLKLYLIIDVVALVTLIILFFFIEGLYQGLTLDEIMRLKVVYIIIGMMTICSIPLMPLNGVYTAYGRVHNVKIFDLVTKLLTILLVCICLYAGHGLYLMVLINAGITVLMNCFKLLFLAKKEHFRINLRYRNNEILKEMFFFSVWLAIAMIADKFFFSVEPSLLGIFSNSTQVAIFAVAAQMEGYVLLFADGLNGIFLPQVTNMVVQKESTEKITSLMIQVGRLQLVVVTALILGIFTQGRDFIEIWFGRDYRDSYYAVIIVLIPCFVHLTQGIAAEMIYATNNVKYRAISYCVGAVVNIGVTISLAPKFGAIGAAIGIAMGFLIGHELIMNLVYRYKLKLNIKRFFLCCHGKMIIPALFSTISGLLISHYISIAGMKGVLLKCILWLIIYCALVYMVYLNKQEKKMIKGLLLRKK